jgi:hypothetical protein
MTVIRSCCKYVALNTCHSNSLSVNWPLPRHHWTVLASLIAHTVVYSNVPNWLDLDIVL